MPSYQGPEWSVKQGVLTINAAQFWAIGHYTFNTFKATGNHTITAIRAPGYRTTGATGTIRVGIQAVTGAQMGSLPTGTWLVYEDVAVTTYTTTMANKWITLTTPYTLTKNSFYAIVVNAESGTFNSSTQIFFSGYNTSSYAAGAAFFPTTGRMAASNSVGIGDYVLGYRTSSQAYYGVVMPLADDSAINVEMGARFIVPSGQYSSIECLGIRNKSNAAAQQTVRLYDSSNTVIATATPQFDITAGRAIYDTYWDTAVNLTAGQTYYWGTVCPTSTQWSSQVSVDAVTDWMADTGWQFAKARRTTPVTGAWTITTTENYEHQLILGNAIASAPPYLPTERNAGVITIAPGSTSQSIELYLGITGLTTSSAGLSARYNRTRTASVSIPLVARTIAQAWTAGGFAEVDATNMPGVYRLDLPDAALAAGADDVTIVVRGASGTNGAVMTVKLSSGGLTSAQTAAAVWDEARSSHVTAGTFGQYVNAELVTPVTSAALVRMGPFEVKADGLGASDPIDIQKGAQHGVDIQCVDAFGSGIDITSATVTAKVYNSGATLVDTYACTATYAADGRATFTIDTTVTDTPGTYTATITRTTGASDTQVFGPLRIYVRDI
jgi:hypothetical protein